MTPLATATAPILQAAQLAAENGPALLAIDGQEGSRRTAVCIIEHRFAAQKRLQNLVSQPNEIYICAGLLLPVCAARSKR